MDQQQMSLSDQKHQQQQKHQQLPDIFTLQEIENVVESEEFVNDLIDGLEDGFIALQGGDFFAAPIQTLGLPPFPFVDGDVDGYAAQTCIKTGYFKGREHYVVKVASGGYPLPNSGLIQVYSQRTGKLEALLLDEGLLTEIRTAAVGALAAKTMAPKRIDMIGIVGTGVQARYQLSMLRHVTKCRNVMVYGRNPSNVRELCQELNSQGWETHASDAADPLLEQCDIVVTTTCSREPILGNTKLTARASGLHITCIGADAPGKVELNPQLVSMADLLVADTRQQSIERGEFQQSVASGQIKEDMIMPLGEFLQNKGLHRTSDEDNRLTILDSSGVALQDCVISSLVMSRIRRQKQSI